MTPDNNKFNLDELDVMLTRKTAHLIVTQATGEIPNQGMHFVRVPEGSGRREKKHSRRTNEADGRKSE